VDTDVSFSCPSPASPRDTIALAHGGGGRMMHDLLERLILPAFRNPSLETRHDAAILALGGVRFAFTTDSYVVSPYVFPGGDIGVLAVNGTLNDLAMAGARPLCLSVSLILEEGCPMVAVESVVASMGRAAREAHVDIVTGDTKVVDRGKGDGIFVNTSGVGVLEHSQRIGPASVQQDDVLILSGDIGRHGIAIMAEREGLAFETTIQSDTASVWPLVDALLSAGIEIHCLRDLTRGGLASALVEIAEAAGLSIEIDERHIPVGPEVRGACEILGFDPLYVANEGRFIAFLPERDAERARAVLRACPLAAEAVVIGAVSGKRPGTVTAKTALGTTRFVDMFSGEQLPRIC
jgi:hydrogenase expression/formation protein HypE